MYLNPSLLATVLSISRLSSAKPIDGKVHAVKRDDPVSYPYGDALPNEFQWLGWDAEDEDQKKDGQKIHEAFKQWADLAKAGVTAVQGAPDNVHFKRFFGTQGAADTTAIQNTMANMYDNTANTATETIKKMVLDRKDFGDHCVKDGWFAYTDAPTGKFHICPKGIAMKLNSDTQCTDFKRDWITFTARTLPFAMLHEFTHYDSVTDDRIGLMEDHAQTSYDCFMLDEDEKQSNAQNYAFNAAEQYWSDECPDKDFKDPQDVRPTPSPTPTPTPTPTPEPEPVAPYADQPGQCHIHVNEYETCDSHDENLSVEITMWDVSGAQIGYADRTVAGAGNPLMMKSKLENVLEVTPENQKNYIQFTLGGQSWATNKDNDESAPAYCKVGGWDPRAGPLCNEFDSGTAQESKRQMDCYFQCPWGGGATSDGS